jgi:hypothetical protein
MYSTKEDCTLASQDNIQVSVLKEVGQCVDVALDLPSPLDSVRSYYFKSCENKVSGPQLEFELYLKTGCRGYGVEYVIKNKFNAECANSTVFSCQSLPTAVEDMWPAIGVFMDDMTCAAPNAIVAVAPGCVSYLADYDIDEMRLECLENDIMRFSTYENGMTCADEYAITEVTFPSSQCLTQWSVTDENLAEYSKKYELLLPPSWPDLNSFSILEEMSYFMMLPSLNPVEIDTYSYSGYYLGYCHGF